MSGHAGCACHHFRPLKGKQMPHSNTHSLHPLRWGEWELDREQLVLVNHAAYGYRVHLEECTSSAEVLDWIMQIANKSWGTHVCLGSLVDALNALLRPQANLCFGGEDKQITSERVIELVSENELKLRARRTRQPSTST